MQVSMVLPAGRYLASVHFLQLLQATFAKQFNGMSEHDLNHKDKLNFDAVTDKSIITLFNRIPDAKATSGLLLLLICCVIESFLHRYTVQSLKGLGASPNYFFQNKVILRFRGEGVSHVTFCLPTNVGIYRRHCLTPCCSMNCSY